MGERVINLWEDEHQSQSPVLTSFTDPGLLNDHDGNWDKFDYSGRPFPTILAGHNEWENNALQPIHFHANGLANGRYEVWANLYTGGTTRHYYGFSETEALAGARFVDNVQGEEYLLTTIEITDGTFNLWAGNADILSGSNYFYGWAWIKLIPTL